MRLVNSWVEKEKKTKSNHFNKSPSLKLHSPVSRANYIRSLNGARK
jgi:hypothetical protein